MAYKGKTVTVHSSSHFVTELKDFMITCGWAVEGPSTDPGAQDDDEGFILGWFLSSAGEDTDQDLHVHLGVNKDFENQEFVNFDYLNVGGTLADDATTVPVRDGTGFGAGDLIRIQNELILVGAVSTNDLTGCTRGWGLTDPATHADFKVVQIVNDASGENSRPCIETFCFSDLGTAIRSSNAGAADWSTYITADFSGDANFDDADVTTNRFGWHTMMKVTSGGQSGKMRFVYANTDSGIYTTQKFFTVPGNGTDAELVCTGFLPGWSRRASVATINQHRILGVPYIETEEAGTVIWMYGCKDGVLVVAKRPADLYYPFYFGNVIPYGSPLRTTTTGALSPTDVTIPVTNVDLFTPGQKIRLMSQDIADWQANEDRSADTYGGAAPGSWPDFDPEEIPSEECEVQSVGAADITLAGGLIYSYTSGAIIGEAPRPIVRNGNGMDGSATYLGWITATVSVGGWCAGYRWTPKSVITSHASHRSFWRSYHVDNEAYTTFDGVGTDDGASKQWPRATRLLLTADETIIMEDNENYVTDQLLLGRWVLQNAVADGDHVNQILRGQFHGGLGVIPFAWVSMQNPPLAGGNEDTVESQWGGAYETFRIFDINPHVSYQAWLICGPEIA